MSEEKVYDKRVRWQYHTFTCHGLSPESEFFEMANRLGMDGWELMSTNKENHYTSPGFSEIYMSGIFKRPLRCYTNEAGEVTVDFVI